ncbi:GNAT family N-acetyltransferase [Avrilella dinanensis]|uniref:GNAT family N-acetyltransferase n=1 Tax=Avrilella dinanensis TaxID=2008672 RepID=UPI003C6C17FA
MMQLETEKIYLRALEPEDLDYIYQIENDVRLWEVSHTQTPYSRYLIRQYLENAHQDIYEAKQLRMVVVNKSDNQPVGLIDLFDFDPKNERVGLGIVVSDQSDRQKGYASDAVELLIKYAFKALHCHQIFVNIDVENEASTRLFTKFGFELIGIKKQWNRFGSQRKDEALYQLINIYENL